jgi:hypothetical protein
VKETNVEEETSPTCETKSESNKRKKKEKKERRLALGETARNTPIKSDDDLGDCCVSPASKPAILAPIFSYTPAQDSKRTSKRTQLKVPTANKKKL